MIAASLPLERAGREHAAVQRVTDRDALEVGGVDDVGEVLELVEDRVEADRLGTGVVDEVGRVAADEARLQLGRDLRRRGDLDGRALVGLGEDVGGELDVVDAVAAVEDHGIDGGVLGHAEWVDGVDTSWDRAVATGDSGVRDAGGADDACLGEIGGECGPGAHGCGATDEAATVGGCLFDLVLVHVVVYTFLVEWFGGWGTTGRRERSLPLMLHSK